MIERLELKFLRRPAVRYLDVILSSSGEPRSGAGDYVLVIPGGGTGHPGAADATTPSRPPRRLAAARIETRFVGPADPIPAGEPGAARFRVLGVLPSPKLAALMRSARLIVANGGSTLLQALASGAACVAVAIAGDQRDRIRRCAAVNAAVEAQLASDDIVTKAAALLGDETARAALARRAALGLEDGIAVALRALGPLIEDSADRYAMPNAVLLGYDLSQPSFRHRMRSLVPALETAGWQVRCERFPSGRYGVRTFERRKLLAWADVVVLHQIKLSPLEARLFGALAKHRIFDVDDAIYVRKPRRLGEPPDDSPWRRRKFAATCRWVEVVAAGNGVLAGVARPAARGWRCCRPRSTSDAIGRPRPGLPIRPRSYGSEVPRISSTSSWLVRPSRACRCVIPRSRCGSSARRFPTGPTLGSSASRGARPRKPPRSARLTSASCRSPTMPGRAVSVRSSCCGTWPPRCHASPRP